MTPRLWFVVPAAGASRRMGAAVPKQYLECGGRTVLEWSLTPLLRHPDVAGGVVVLAADDRLWSQLPEAVRSRVMTVPGGEDRCHSVLEGLRALADVAAPDDGVLVHDAARPCLPAIDLQRLIESCAGDAIGGLLAIPLADSLKRAVGHRVDGSVNRAGLWRALTPQLFRYGLLVQALAAAIAAGERPTDEAAALERLGLQPLLVEGSAVNIKVTRPLDLAFAAAALGLKGEGV